MGKEENKANSIIGRMTTTSCFLERLSALQDQRKKGTLEYMRLLHSVYETWEEKLSNTKSKLPRSAEERKVIFK